MNILVTGGAGFIGSVPLPCFLQHGHRVTVIDDFSSGKQFEWCKQFDQRLS